MRADELMRRIVVSVSVNNDYTEATLVAADGSRLHFCHRVDERWARATPGEAFHAQGVLEAMSRFRLNGKHLELFFADGSRWEALFR